LAEFRRISPIEIGLTTPLPGRAGHGPGRPPVPRLRADHRVARHHVLDDGRQARRDDVRGGDVGADDQRPQAVKRSRDAGDGADRRRLLKVAGQQEISDVGRGAGDRKAPRRLVATADRLGEDRDGFAVEEGFGRGESSRARAAAG
jgi:hypothetical protein